MKLLINLCAHDGIISHYTGVGTMVHKYIYMINKILTKYNYDYHLNLITPQYNKDSFGYSDKYCREHSFNTKTSIIQISNGSNGTQNFGNIDNWKELTKNTAQFINQNITKDYDKIITIYNDVPFTNLARFLDTDSKHIKVWIPHSSGLIHNEDEFRQQNSQEQQERIDLELSAVQYINKMPMCYLGYISEYMKEHFVREYGLLKNKLLNLKNGEVLDDIDFVFDDLPKIEKMFGKIKDYDNVLLSFGRAEKYKNHEATLKLGAYLDVKTIIVPQSYYKGQPIIDEYKKLAQKINAIVLDDAPFDFVHYFLKNFKGNIIVLIPSTKEPMGLIVNEIRKYNKDNILLVVNDIPGLREQVKDGVDGVLVNVEDFYNSAIKIKKYYNLKNMRFLKTNAFKTLKEKYNFEKTFENFIKKVVVV